MACVEGEISPSTHATIWLLYLQCELSLKPSEVERELFGRMIHKKGKFHQLVSTMFVDADDRKYRETEVICARDIVHNQSLGANRRPAKTFIDGIETGESVLTICYRANTERVPSLGVRNEVITLDPVNGMSKGAKCLAEPPVTLDTPCPYESGQMRASGPAP
jgi:hypothetical protein